MPAVVLADAARSLAHRQLIHLLGSAMVSLINPCMRTRSSTSKQLGVIKHLPRHLPGVGGSIQVVGAKPGLWALAPTHNRFSFGFSRDTVVLVQYPPIVVVPISLVWWASCSYCSVADSAVFDLWTRTPSPCTPHGLAQGKPAGTGQESCQLQL